ncbi:ATP-binding cassette domain-containing protein [Zavarzinia compransoris]|uniref:ATP-binding cassette domain-containing protein n=1 Tax=Zavarzinia compransoris TaxID=1264899 RepID=UPI001FB5E3A5|nr:ATP-binding cassette domain-containing protein [Zavarzinia compransoris]
MLKVSTLSRHYGGRRALDGVDLQVAPGEIVALLGPNGAGKTTLFRIVEGLIPADGGTVTVAGIEVARRPAAALAALGIVFQETTLDLDLTVAENLRYYAALRGIARGTRAAAAQQALVRLGLEERAGSRARELSGGLRRRVELARALIGTPRLLLLDEPSDALDPASRIALRAEIDRLRHLTGCGVLWATHLVEEVGNADRVVILDRGRVIAAGPPAAIVAAAGGASLTEAFLALTGKGAS